MREAVVVPAGQRLERDESRVVLEVQPDARRGGDFGPHSGANDPLPAKTRHLEPLSKPDMWAEIAEEIGSRRPGAAALVQSAAFRPGGCFQLLRQPGGFDYVAGWRGGSRAPISQNRGIGSQ